MNFRKRQMKNRQVFPLEKFSVLEWKDP